MLSWQHWWQHIRIQGEVKVVEPKIKFGRKTKIRIWELTTVYECVCVCACGYAYVNKVLSEGNAGETFFCWRWRWGADRLTLASFMALALYSLSLPLLLFFDVPQRRYKRNINKTKLKRKLNWNRASCALSHAPPNPTVHERAKFCGHATISTCARCAVLSPLPLL